ncbi:MotE family protein [Lyticum sinuosum]|uniref:Flagellar protein n=1 Tax=Lyticum sinuosum TaxID=1332059 RepID=A0AAE5AGY0_9RICK|nr:hypothetical protein [Lyticum sinuosum]MDZ5760935.1 putative flagellar protein [Lyticum sinuosum]
MGLHKIFQYLIVILSGFCIMKGIDLINSNMVDKFLQFNTLNIKNVAKNVESAMKDNSSKVLSNTDSSTDSNTNSDSMYESSKSNDNQKSPIKILDENTKFNQNINNNTKINTKISNDNQNNNNNSENNLNNLNKNIYDKFHNETYDDYNDNMKNYNYCISVLSDMEFLPNEIKLLQELKKYKEDNDNQKNWLIDKEKALLTIQKDIKDKIDILVKQHDSLEKYMQQHGQGGSNRILKLVKVYENMDPKEAANIFESLNIDVLLKVAENMKENKLAAIISKMKIDKAKLLTTSMVNQKLKQFYISELDE